MTVAELDNQIKDQRNQIAAEGPRYAEQQRKFLDETVAHLNEWYWAYTEHVVTESESHTNGLGADKVAQLKADVRALQSRTADNVNTTLTPARLWWTGMLDDPDFPTPVAVHPVRLTEAIGYVAGRLGPILEKYGYIPADPQAPGSWFHPEHPAAWRDSHRFYNDEFQWSEEMDQAIKEYCDVVVENDGLLRSIEELEKQRDESKAVELWEKAS